MTDLVAYKTLPALRTSLKWFKREIVRSATARAAAATPGRIQGHLYDKVRKLRAMRPAEFRRDYISHRAREICLADLADVIRASGRTWRRL